MKKIILALFLVAIATISLQAEKIAIIPSFNEVKLKLDGIPNESFWKKVSPITSFQCYGKKDVKAAAETCVRICLDKKNLYMAIICDEPKEVSIGTKQSTSPWAADNIEIFFGSIEGRDWFRQVVLALNGSNYYECIKKEDVRHAIKINKNSWSAELVISRDKLGTITNDTLLFNMFRNRYGKEMQTISNLRWALEMEKYMTLKIKTPAKTVLYGPWNTQVTTSSAVICWESVGKCMTSLSFREKGHKIKTNVFADVYGNVADRSQKLHNVKLLNLKPGTQYEYFINEDTYGEFTTLDSRNADFSFTTITDTHGRSWQIAELLQKQYTKESDIFFHLGDTVSGIIGRGSFYDVCLSPISQYWQKPFYIVRGNHESRGNAPKVFMDMVYPNGKAYFSFLHKGVYFVILDIADEFNCDKEFFEKQQNWLLKITESSEFKNAKFRVLLSHYPLYLKKSPMLHKLFDSLPIATQKSFDLALAGHSHNDMKILPNSNKIISNNNKLNETSPSKKMPFLRLVLFNGNINVQKNKNKLTVIIYDTNGQVLDTMIIQAKK